ncbi:hypothetical protein [Streptomyces afghaniensis]|uniref:hypothetical protein n=1 Tax=Streptomyces afghaniensis TaxID=66865 RepID=UPI00278B7E7A|nr:hypothetical protein [Streptomyces afghaniensis]MDQ1014330.1 hypothetical protein [Streptomyces afghaniensis]
MADNVARIIAAASAVFTACTMTISYLTYRRAKPKVILRAQQSWADGVEFPDHGDNNFIGFRIRVLNRGQTAIKLEGFEYEFYPSRRAAVLHRLGVRRLPCTQGAIFRWMHQKDMPTEVEPFDGAPWAAWVPWSQYKDWEPHFVRTRLTLTLTNGDKIYSPWMPRAHSPAFPERARYEDQQLTFDDLTENSSPV